MNQASAAAARHAQEVYVRRLEELLTAQQAEKVRIAEDASAVAATRARLEERLSTAQQGLRDATPIDTGTVDRAETAPDRLRQLYPRRRVGTGAEVARTRISALVGPSMPRMEETAGVSHRFRRQRRQWRHLESQRRAVLAGRL